MSNIKPLEVVFSDHYAPKIIEDPVSYLKQLEEVTGQKSNFLEKIEGKEFECFLVLQFHNEVGIANDFTDHEDYVVPFFSQDKFAYNTNRCGVVTGWTFYIPASLTGVKDISNRDIYKDVNGTSFVIEYRPGSPAYCCRVYLQEPLVA